MGPDGLRESCFYDNGFTLFQVRGDTVEHYTITYEQLTPRHTRARTVTKAKSPYILEDLGRMMMNDDNDYNDESIYLGGPR